MTKNMYPFIDIHCWSYVIYEQCNSFELNWNRRSVVSHNSKFHSVSARVHQTSALPFNTSITVLPIVYKPTIIGKRLLGSVRPTTYQKKSNFNYELHVYVQLFLLGLGNNPAASFFLKQYFNHENYKNFWLLEQLFFYISKEHKWLLLKLFAVYIIGLVPHFKLSV